MTLDCEIIKNKHESLLDVCKESVKSAFLNKGVLLFKQFSYSLEEFKQFTDYFCKTSLSYPGAKRVKVSADDKVQSVDIGDYRIPLHSELSHTPFRPDICWFSCATPAKVGCETLLCDGTKIFNDLDSSLQSYLLKTKLRYQKEISEELWSRFIGRNDINTLAKFLSNHKMDKIYSISGRVLVQNYVAPFITQSITKDKPAIVNNVIHNYSISREMTYPTLGDGSMIPEEIILELIRVAEYHTQEHFWEKGDIIMFDNTRFLHGRNAVVDSDRMIWTRFGDINF